MSNPGKLFLFMTWVLFYLAFLVGWLLHPAHMYYELDGRYAEWTILSRAQWTSFWDFTAIDPMQGMVTLRMPENPWVHLGSLPLLSGADTLVRHIASYTIYWVEFALSTYLLARLVGFSSLVAQIGTQLWLLLAFPPFNIVFGFIGWVMFIPLHVQTIAVGNCLLALFIILGNRKKSMNVLLGLSLVALTIFYFFAAPLRLISVAPGYAFLGACAYLFRPSLRELAWKLGTIAVGTVAGLALHIPDYYRALFGHTPRLWEGMVVFWGGARGRFDLWDSFFCQTGLFCSSRLIPHSLFYGSVLVAGILVLTRRWATRCSRPVRVITIGGAAFYLSMVLIYSLPYIVVWPLGDKFPLQSPVYVYNPLFPIFCLIVTQWWIGIGDWIIRLATVAASWIIAAIRRAVAKPEKSRPSVASREWPSPAPSGEIQLCRLGILLVLVVPTSAVYLASAHFGGGPALSSLVSGLPIARSLRPAPSETPLIHFLKEQIGVSPGKQFKGVVAGYLGSVYGPIGATQVRGLSETFAPAYLQTMDYLRRHHGNSYMYQDLWGFGIPTLEEYGHFIGPANWRVFTDLLTEEPHSQVISTTLTYRTSVRIMRALGVRYLISDVPLKHPDLQLIMRQEAVSRSSPLAVPIYLYELRRPNLATSSPTRLSVIPDATKTVQRMREDDFHMEEQVIVTEPLDGSYVPLSSSAMYIDNNSLRIEAESQGRSLLLLPVQFSRCWQATSLPDGRSAAVPIMRANLAQTLIEFSGEMRIRLAFHLDFGRAADCRRRDIKELREMRILAGSAPWPRTRGKGTYLNSQRE